MKNTIFLIPLLILSLSNCNSDKEHPKNEPYTTFKVDSIKTYPAEGIPKNRFMFSPLSEKNKIWTINTANIHELDLKTGEWIPLSKKYDKGFIRQVNESGIWKDSVLNEVFISLFHDCLLYFDLKKDTFFKYDIHPVTALINAKDKAIIGTANGLYFINKIDKTISQAPGFPLDFWVSSIDIVNNDSISLNEGKLYYKVDVSNFEKKEKKKKHSKDPFLKNLPRKSGASRYSKIPDKHANWYYCSNRLFFKDSINHFYEFNLLPNSYLRQLKLDQQFLYLLFRNKFVIINKQFAFANSKKFDLSSYQKEKIELSKINKSFNNISIDSFLMSYNAIKSDFSLVTDNTILESFEASARNYLLNLRDDKRLKDAEKAIDQNTFPKELEKYALLGLCMKYLQAYNLDKVEYYGNMLKENYPEFDFYNSKYVLNCCSKIKTSLDSLKNENLPKDEFLYKESLQIEKLIQCGWFGESYYDFTLLYKSYQNLLTKFPESLFADNVKFRLIETQSYGAEDEGYSSEQIKSYYQFIRTYPNSDLIPHARINIATMLNEYYGNIDKVIEMKEKAIEELDKINTKNLPDTNLVNLIDYTRAYILYEINERIFEIKAVTNQTEFKLDEDITFKVILKNKTNKSRLIELFAERSPFSTIVGPDKTFEFIQDSLYQDTSLKILNIAPNDSLIYRINLISDTRHWEGNKIGNYKFNKPGLYYLALISSGQKIRSKQIKFYINE